METFIHVAVPGPVQGDGCKRDEPALSLPLRSIWCNGKNRNRCNFTPEELSGGSQSPVWPKGGALSSVSERRDGEKC